MAILEKMTRGKGRNAKATINYVDDKSKCEVLNVNEETGEVTQEHLRSGVNCDPDYANKQMYETRLETNKNDGVQAHHFSLSFNPSDNLTPQEHHAHAVNFSERNFPNREVLVVTHTDTDHVHSHIVINSIDMETGKRYHRDAKETHADNQRLNEYCKEYDLSFTEPNKEKGKAERYSAPADKYKNAETSLFITLEQCKNSSTNDREFLQKLEEQGIIRSHYSDSTARYTDSGGVKLTAKKISKVYAQDYTRGGLEREFQRNIKEFENTEATAEPIKPIEQQQPSIVHRVPEFDLDDYDKKRADRKSKLEVKRTGQGQREIDWKDIDTTIRGAKEQLNNTRTARTDLESKERAAAERAKNQELSKNAVRTSKRNIPSKSSDPER